MDKKIAAVAAMACVAAAVAVTGCVSGPIATSGWLGGVAGGRDQSLECWTQLVICDAGGKAEVVDELVDLGHGKALADIVQGLLEAD